MAQNINRLSQPEPASQGTFVPVKKVTFGAAAGALVTIAVYVLNTHVPAFEGNKKISPEVSSAATTVLTFIVSYLVPPGKNEAIAEEDGQLKSARQ